MAKVPSERSLVDTYSDRPFALIGVNSDAPGDALNERVAQAGINWRSFADETPRGPIATDWGVSAWPTTFLIDHEGVVYARDLGGARLEDAIEELLALAEDGEDSE